MRRDSDSQATLESWKAIASYLQRDVRTVQRWESEEGLPVHRHAHKKLATVYAYTDEIDHWRSERAPEIAAQRSFGSYIISGALVVIVVLVALAMSYRFHNAPGRPQAEETWFSELTTMQTQARASMDEHIVLGWHYFDSFNSAQAMLAEEQFALALKDNPDDVEALVGIALTQVLQAFLEVKPSRRAYEEAEAFALRALELDPTEGEALAVLGWVEFVYRWNWTAAEQRLREAVKESPASPWPHYFLANYLSALNRPVEAERSIVEALRLRPSSPLVMVARGYMFANAGKPREAVEYWIRNSETLGPELVSRFLIYAYEDLAEFDNAVRIIVQMGHPQAEKFERALRDRGEVGYWEVTASVIAEQLTQFPDMFSWRYALATAKSGETESALAMLERGFHQRNATMVFLPVYHFQALYGEPVFRDLVDKMGLQEAFAGKLP